MHPTVGAADAPMAEAEKVDMLMAVVRPCFAEFVGTFILAFAIGCTHMLTSMTELYLRWVPTAQAAAVMGLTYLFGPVSGGNFNPAISLAMGICGKLPWVSVGIYIPVQLFAAALGALTVAGAFNSYAPVLPQQGVTSLASLEVVFTMLLCFVFINCCAGRRNNPPEDYNHFFGMAVGFVVLAAGYTIGPLDGASLNPAVAIGYAAGQSPSCVLGYVMLQLLGALLGAVLFVAARPEDYLEASDAELASFRASMWTRLLIEFTGSFIVVLTFGMATFMAAATQTQAAPLAVSAVLVALIYASVNISGAHFNPAVTLAVVLSGRNKVAGASGALYVAVQLLGAGFAALALTGYHAAFPAVRLIAFGTGPLQPFAWEAAACVELIFTFLLAFIQLAVETVTMPYSFTSMNFFFGLAIGMCFAIGGFIGGLVSGGHLNPALSLGLALEGGMSSARVMPPPFYHCMWYTVCQLMGAAGASLLFRFTHPQEYPQSKLTALLQY
mmetsp:Transcript_7961/g.17698  ORF Transcript_7961/g.17698 Transcript_7961/m.17698 type:complete len:498 (+) Transcript_7961:76-1569(+)